jgi:hypothetical protein
MRLSDAGLRRCKTKQIYPNHRPPPWLTEADPTRDRSNRLLDARADGRSGGNMLWRRPHHLRLPILPRPTTSILTTIRI